MRIVVTNQSVPADGESATFGSSGDIIFKY
jgi:hypothetical protein